MRDLYNDLGRIAGLGFECIQIMPRQPFPSYNIYDLADVTTSYGDEDDLRLVVEACHALGMKVILDILMHGVIDADIIHRAADRVRNGPYFERLNEGTEVQHDPEYEAYDGQDYLVAWSRHILDFEEHWAGGSPGEHPLVAQHPEWFVRRSDGEIIGVYTKAFDGANLAWQEYFTEAALDLVRRLGIDGFRFDAPTYNEVPNWSPETEKRASASQLGSVEHFARLRTALKALNPNAMLYTEPSGTLFRQTMDITYNYDEHWLIHTVLRPESAAKQHPLGIRHARDLAMWMRDKESALPNGAITARHIDSHDTFWWPLPGFKWRREQYGLPATRALLATFSLIGGVYMTFVGGEVEVEDDIRRMTRLRATVPEIRLGRVYYDSVRADHDAIFAVAREREGQVSLVLVNLSKADVSTTVSLDTAFLQPASAYRVFDAWNDVGLEHSAGYIWSGDRLGSFEVAFAPYQARVLTIRPVEPPPVRQTPRPPLARPSKGCSVPGTTDARTTSTTITADDHKGTWNIEIPALGLRWEKSSTGEVRLVSVRTAGREWISTAEAMFGTIGSPESSVVMRDVTSEVGGATLRLSGTLGDTGLTVAVTFTVYEDDSVVLADIVVTNETGAAIEVSSLSSLRLATARDGAAQAAVLAGGRWDEAMPPRGYRLSTIDLDEVRRGTTFGRPRTGGRPASTSPGSRCWAPAVGCSPHSSGPGGGASISPRAGTRT